MNLAGIDLAQDKGQWTLLNTLMDLQVPHNVGEFLSNCTTGSLLRSQLHRVIVICCYALQAFSKSNYEFKPCVS
jgi:isopenicillin N synthase-like dioxygenase